MKRLAGLASVTAGIALVSAATAAVAAAKPGDLDRSFSGGGIARADEVWAGSEVAVDKKGRVYVAGTGDSVLWTHMAVARFLPDGRLDTSFGENGVATSNPATTENGSSASAIALDGAGRIYLGGRAENATGDFAVVRFTPDGDKDSAFGGVEGEFEGTAVTDIEDADSIRDLAIDAQGRLVAVGVSDFGPIANFAVVRYLTSGPSAGDEDDSFGGTGVEVRSFGGDDRPSSVAFGSGGRIIVAGSTTFSGGPLAFASLLPSGDNDSSFGANGLAQIDPAGSDDAEVNDVVALPGGRIVALGAWQASGGPEQLALYALTQAGELDESFGADGVVKTTGGPGRDALGYGMAVDGWGRIVAAGRSRVVGDPGSSALFAARFSAGGAFDPSFGRAGAVRHGVTTQGSSAAIDPRTSRIVLGGLSGEAVRLESHPRCAGRVPTLVGTPRGEVLIGSARRDVIAGAGGADRVRGLRGRDRLCGEAGNDRMFGGPGPDLLLGQRGRDLLLGGPGFDRLLGGPGGDRLRGGPGRDRLRGGPGRDQERP